MSESPLSPLLRTSTEDRCRPRFKSFPIASARLQVIEDLKKTDLEWTAIYPGFFMEIIMEGLPTHIKANRLFIDVGNNVAAIPNKGEGKITLTYSRDIAKYIPKLLSLKNWEQRYFILGEVKTWNEIVAAAEVGKGVKFDVTYDSIEKLKKGEVTELPAHAAVYESFGGREKALPVLQGLFAQYGLWMDEGLFSKHDGTKLNDLFPEIEPLKLHEAWKMSRRSL